ncbi:MAG: magnetosome biogenesis CDF transporter MamB [Gammaproteobacteria bacterium SHHR-1]|uniref:magnetosome biogenesis CDF transporter MamB n=1 Tax=Magnetovirga frankeli TaxID=947516 RepID=UPI00029D0E6A|nr:magnetosome protein [gamma proteobacterium SS-5]QFY89624.1 magnetosome biogenesis CDF transporter MamB [gamma proteobacterium SS-5]
MKFEHCKECRNEVVWWAFFVNIAQMTYKGLLGVMTGSAALIADAMHSGADVVASSVTMASLKISAKPADERHPYGYGNIQFISSSIVGLILILGAIYLIYESFMAILAGEISAPNVAAVLGAALSALTNELMYRYQSCVATENNSPAIMANAWDNRSDALSSLAVLVGILVAVMGFPIADNLAAIAVGFMVVRIGVELNTDAISGLMDSSIEIEDLKEVYDLVNEIDGVEGIAYLRGRNVGEDLHVEINIKVNRNLSVAESDQISDWVTEKIEYEVGHVKDVLVLLTPVEVVGKKKPRVIPDPA